MHQSVHPMELSYNKFHRSTHACCFCWVPCIGTCVFLVVQRIHVISVLLKSDPVMCGYFSHYKENILLIQWVTESILITDTKNTLLRVVGNYAIMSILARLLLYSKWRCRLQIAQFNKSIVSNNVGICWKFGYGASVSFQWEIEVKCYRRAKLFNVIII